MKERPNTEARRGLRPQPTQAPAERNREQGTGNREPGTENGPGRGPIPDSLFPVPCSLLPVSCLCVQASLALRVSRLRSAALLLAALAALAIGGCIQERTAHDDPPAAVTARINFSPDLVPLPFPALVPPVPLKENSPMGLRAHMVMTGIDPRENDNDMVHNDGAVTVLTRRTGKGFFAVRGAHYDLGYAPVDVGSLGSVTPVTMLRPFDGENHFLSLFQPPLTGNFDPSNPNCDGTTVRFPKGIRMMPKEPGRVKFVFFADDPKGQLNQGRVEGRGNDSPFPVVISVLVIGDFNQFRLPTPNSLEGAIELLDEGSQFCPATDPLGPFDDPRRPISGDEKSGDRVFCRYVYNLPPGDLRYAFVINQSPLTITDPYEEGSARVRIVTQNEVREFKASVITVK